MAARGETETKRNDILSLAHPGLLAGVAFLTLLFAGSAPAQPRSIEVFGMAGYGHANDDEGSLGNGPVYSGALTLPFLSRLALDLDIMHNRTKRTTALIELRTQRTTFNPGLQFRWGGERTYGFAGLGAGYSTEERSVDFEGHGITTYHDSGLTLHTRGGLVTAFTPRLLLRTEVYLSFRYVAPDVGVKAGVGYRF